LKEKAQVSPPYITSGVYTLPPHQAPVPEEGNDTNTLNAPFCCCLHNE